MQPLKPALSILLCMIGLCLYGQPRLNFAAGMSITNLTEDFIGEYGFDQFRSAYISQGGSATSEAKNGVRPGYYASLLGDFYTSERVFIRSGLKYFNAGDSYFFKTDDVVIQSNYGAESDGRYILRQQLSYLSIPVNIGKKLDRVTLFGGAIVALNTSNFLRTSYYEADGSRVTMEWEKLDNPVAARNNLFFLNGGLDYFIPSGGRLGYFMEIGVSYSLASVYYDERAVASFRNAHALNIDLGFGIQL